MFPNSSLLRPVFDGVAPEQDSEKSLGLGSEVYCDDAASAMISPSPLLAPSP